MDEVGLALGEGSVYVGRLRRGHDEAQLDGFLLIRQRILIQEVTEHPC